MHRLAFCKRVVFKLLRVDGISSVAPFVIARMRLDQGIVSDFLSVRSIILSEGAGSDTTAANVKQPNS